MTEQTIGNGTGAIHHADFRFLVDKNADGIIVLDGAGTVLFANPAAEAIFGRASEELTGTAIGIPAIAGETAELAVHRPGGEKIDVEIRVVETIWEGQKALLASLRDISARRAMEEQLRHAAKMEAVGRLTAGIAHDFNNLLTVVIGNLDLARRAAEGTQPLTRALENAMRGATRGATLTERLLAFARRKPLEPRPIDPNQLVSSMSELLLRTLGEHISVETILAPDLWPIEVDPTELEAAILNLAVNSRDAMPSGGKLVIETANVELDSTYAAFDSEVTPGCYVAIALADTGSGMTQDVLAQAFEPFFTTKSIGQGTGLGLSHVYGFVKQSGGHVKIYSEPGMGTTVKIYLPRLTETGVEIPNEGIVAQAPEAPRRASGETILVVEDDPDVRDYATACLTALGYHVLQAQDGATALAMLDAAEAPHLLLTDLGLPGGIDGRDVARQAREKHPAINVLLMTAYAAGGLMHDGRLDPDVELLPKPFTPADLSNRVYEILHRHRRPRILLIEDEPLVRMTIADALTGAGCQVEEVENGAKARDRCLAAIAEFSAIIVDIGLPDCRGDTLVADIRKMHPEIPIILATGYADEALCRRFAQERHLQVVGKPFDPSQLQLVLEGFGITFPDRVEVSG